MSKINFRNLKYIFYFHVMTDDIRKRILNIREKQNREDYLIMADDGHISIKDDLDLIDYVNITQFNMKQTSIYNNIINSNAPDYNINLQSAYFHAKRYHNYNGFMYYKDIPVGKRLNHTYSHDKYCLADTNSPCACVFDISTCKNWWVCNYNDDKYIYNDYYKECHLSFDNGINEIDSEINLIVCNENTDIVVAPWNIINKEFIMSCLCANVKYIIYSSVYDVKHNKDLRIPRLDLEKI